MQKPDPIEDTVQTVEFKMYIENSIKPVLLNVKKKKTSADVKVVSFPNHFLGSLAFRKNFVNPDECNNVKNTARLYKVNSSSGSRTGIKLMVRNANLRIDLNSYIKFADQDFEVDVKKFISKKLGISEFQIKYDNNFKLTDANIDITYKEQAISNLIDEKHEFDESLHDFKNIIMNTKGYTSVQNKFKDLVCDLYSGNAKLTMEFKGRYNEDDKDFIALVNFDNIKSINESN
ncbi:hypothetical protein [Fluviispira sanaruensis]|uniref:Uncharacterized protein n=1 Tax=Fluviispira sanaruensis TaxID=2493639 RepID=A0A4P2VXR6_FLUSA|nr:hypothetical protein [Fluviispira sanaruensis]BBH53812.1 hypothetical protein JCM31447_22620 [Fluviispira sanaruensis]